MEPLYRNNRNNLLERARYNKVDYAVEVNQCYDLGLCERCRVSTNSDILYRVDKI